ncbi:MAG: tryptophan--tRNA ligase [Clostridia bacterium]|nr:tryptophan--tRNA ligase [Clostridia bacterium]
MENTNAEKKTILSGIQPSGTLTIGNYLGALRNWAKIQYEYNCYFCVVDLHAITVRQVPAELRQNSLKTMALYLAAGIDPRENAIFLQSHVPAHAQLGWVLDCFTMFGELSRMTQFKDKSAKHADNINAGLFTYPVLMAADILLYQADLVPVGADQKQHIEIARDIAIRFNNTYSDTFKIPEPYMPKIGTKIMSLTDPLSKMSKSDPGDGSVFLLDSRDTVIRKIKRAVTDSGSEVRFAEGKDGINNLMNIYAAFTGKTYGEIEREFEGKGYGDFKLAVGEVAADALSALQDKYNVFLADKAQLDAVLTDGAERASYTANKTLRKVYRKVGFYSVNK